MLPLHSCSLWLWQTCQVHDRSGLLECLKSLALTFQMCCYKSLGFGPHQGCLFKKTEWTRQEISFSWWPGNMLMGITGSGGGRFTIAPWLGALQIGSVSGILSSYKGKWSFDCPVPFGCSAMLIPLFSHCQNMSEHFTWCWSGSEAAFCLRWGGLFQRWASKICKQMTVLMQGLNVCRCQSGVIAVLSANH